MAKLENFVEKFLQEFPEQKKEYEKQKKRTKFFSKQKYKFLCQCKSGHIFDYRKRIKYDDEYYAPCQGKCPICGGTQWSNIMLPIKWNFLG